MAFSCDYVFILSLLSMIFLVFACVSSNNRGGGFSVQLYNRDFTHDTDHPLPDSITLHDRVASAVRRSDHRVRNYLGPALNKINTAAAADSSPPIVSTVIPSGGSYSMTLSLGSQQTKIKAIADTGSDLIWTQCSPCTGCYKQDDPLFDPSRSTSYRNLACRSNPCQVLPSANCTTGHCGYEYGYGDGSVARGVLASETFTFDTADGFNAEIQNMFFGCGQYDAGTFNRKSDGLVGLAAGSLSLVRQIESRINSQFSYCLVPLADNMTTSLLTFGLGSIPSERGVVTTPITIKQNIFYNLRLESITVGEVTIDVPAGTEEFSEGNIIIDSGTTLTYLDTGVVDQLNEAVQTVVKLTPTEDPGGMFTLCYVGSVEDDALPSIYFHFSGGVVELFPMNTFLPINEGVVCLGILPNYAAGGQSIYGNVAQQNFKIGYDLAAMALSLVPAKCNA